MSSSTPLNSSVRSIISEAVQSGSLPSSINSLSGVADAATPDNSTRPNFASPSFTSSGSMRVPNAPVKAPQSSLGTSGLFDDQLKPKNLFGSSPVSNSSSSSGSIFDTGNKPSGIFASQSSNTKSPSPSNSMGMNNLFQQPASSQSSLGTSGLFQSPASQSSSRMGNLFQQPASQNSLGISNLFQSPASQSSLGTAVPPQSSSSSVQSQSSSGMSNLFQMPSSIRSSQNSLGMSNLFQPSNVSLPPQSSPPMKQNASGGLFDSSVNTLNRPPSIPQSSLNDKISALKSLESSGSNPSISGRSSIHEKLDDLKKRNQAIASARSASPPKFSSSPSSSLSMIEDKPKSQRKSLSDKLEELRSKNLGSLSREERFEVSSGTNLALGNETPKVTHREPLHNTYMKIFDKFGITVDHVKSTDNNDAFFIFAYTRSGANFVCEVKTHHDVTVHLDNGTILEKHEGEDFNFGSNLLNAECEKSGTCGFFGQEGNKVVVSKHKDNSHHKSNYIVVVNNTEKSFIEDHNIVALPQIDFELLETDDANVYRILTDIEDKYNSYCFTAAAETYNMVLKSRDNLVKILENLDIYAREYRQSYLNFEYWQDRNLNSFRRQMEFGDVLGEEKTCSDRKMMYHDLKCTIQSGRTLAKVVNHSANSNQSMVDELNEMRKSGNKYML